MGQWESSTRKMNNHYQNAGQALQAGQWFNSAVINGERAYTAGAYVSPAYTSFNPDIENEEMTAYCPLDFNNLTDLVADKQGNGTYTIFAKQCLWKEETLLRLGWSNTGLTSATLNGEAVSVPFSCPIITPIVESIVIGIAIIDDNYIALLPSWLTNGVNTVSYFQSSDFQIINSLGTLFPNIPMADTFMKNKHNYLQKNTVFPSGWSGIYDYNNYLSHCAVSYGGYGESGKQGYSNNNLDLDGSVSYWNAGTMGYKEYQGSVFQTVRIKTGYLPVIDTDLVGNINYANSQVIRAFLTQVTGNIYKSYKGAIGGMYWKNKIMPYTVAEWELANEPFGCKIIKDSNDNVVGNIFVFVNHRIKEITATTGTLIS